MWRGLVTILGVAALAVTGCGGGGTSTGTSTGTVARTGTGTSTGRGTGTGSGSGTASVGSRPRPATLVLDFTPNAIHAGIYAAIAHHFDSAEGLRLQIIAPSASTDSVSLLETGRVNFAILDLHDLAIARERGADLVGIMAIVQRPLAAVIAQPAVRSPRQLSGETVGITGDPSDTAVLDSIVAGAGGNPRTIRTITIGFNAVPALLAGRVAAATGFWNDEGVTLALDRPGFRIFRVDDYGAPSYPELVLCATHSSLEHDPGLARGVVAALVRGYEFTIANPRAASSALESMVPGLDPKLVAAQLTAELPAFAPVGKLDVRSLRRWAAWEARFGIVARAPDVGAMFAPAFVNQVPAG
jgi:putative hydroxymethylpyrimidine transport system substrate-binding protein